MAIDLRSLRDILKTHCDKGWYLFPVKRETKLPAIKDNLNLASNDIEMLMRWAEKFPNCNWGLSLAKSGLVAVDVDEKGLDPWEALTHAHGEPKTLCARSGSGFGFHYLFKADREKRYRGKIVRGIDIKYNGFILIFPSIHPKTKIQYRFKDDSPIVDYPAWVGKLIEKEASQVGQASPVYKFAGAHWYQRIIEEIKKKSFGYEEWVKLGMSLHQAFGGGQEGLELFLDLSSGVSFKEGDLERAKAKWGSFKVSPGGVGIGSFIFHAKNLGCSIPTPNFEEDREAFGSVDSHEEGEKERDEEWKTNYYGHKFSDNADFIVKEINRRGFAMLGDSQEGVIIRHWTDGQGVEQFRTMNAEVFKNALKDHSFKTLGANRIPKFIPASEVWMKSTKKSRYRNVVFKPDADFEDLNLWSGIPCSPIEGDCSLALELILVLCGGNSLKAQYLLKWLAHMVQRPGEKCVTVPVLISEDEGAGKGLFTDGLLQAILTRSFYIRIDKPGIIKERFNAEQSRKFLTVLDEASWKGDFELANVMKSLTGSSTMTVEEKFGGRYTIENYSRYMVTSNNVEAVKIGLSNRRYLVLEARMDWKGTSKFKQFADALRNGGLHRAFYSYLMNLPLNGFDPFEFPESLDTGGQDTKLESLGPVGQFWFDRLFEANEDAGALFNSRPPIFFINKIEAYDSFLKHCEEVRTFRRPHSLRAFVRETDKLVPGLSDTESVIRIGGKNTRIWVVNPQTFAQSFCKRARIKLPEDFDALSIVNFSSDFT